MAGQSQTITVAAGQLEARLMNEAPATLASIDAAIRRAAQLRVDLLVLPECAYPAYLLGSAESYRAGGHLTGEAYVRWLAERARRYRLHVVSGFVEDGGDRLYNSAVLIDARGREVGRARKRFLWHADHDWFEPGDDIRAMETALGRIGIVICAEARVPEILATLAADGAELIALPTCWINHAREPGRYWNPQTEYLIEARAREFGLPFVCADKAGLELGAVGYVGQSRIVRADGSVAAEAPPTGEAVVAARVRCRPGRKTWVSPSRRARLLRLDDSRPNHESHQSRDRVGADGGSEDTGAARSASGSRRVVVAAMPTAAANARYSGGMGETLFEPLRERGVNLLLVNMAQEAPAEQLAVLSRAFDIHALGFPTEAGVFDFGPARAGCVAGQWVRSFPACRDLALAGAEVLLLFDVPRDLAILRARALENRVFVMGVADRWAVIIGPDGSVLARCDESEPAEVVAEIDLNEALNKSVAPRTDIFAERRVHLYRF
ncbi:MAG: hypothetical protein HRF43_06500 [Phycisphaerae bacterium]|jgi:predicted amidohydrolase